MNSAAETVFHTRVISPTKVACQLTIVNTRMAVLDLSQVFLGIQHLDSVFALNADRRESGSNNDNYQHRAKGFFSEGRAVPVAHHVPWAVDAFEDVCRRCDACIRACEEAILVAGDGGFPRSIFAVGVHLCAACVDACSTPRSIGHCHHPGSWRSRSVTVA